MKICLFIIAFTYLSYNANAQAKTDANVFGDVKSKGEHLAGVTIYVKGTSIGTITDKSGHYFLVNLPEGEHIIEARLIGYKKAEKKVISEKGKSVELNFDLSEESIGTDEIVVTGTRTEKRITDSPVIVNSIDAKSLEMVNATSISEGLCYQPGLRLETDCQTCNYTQLRMNGLGGAYSQILINGKSLFSPILSLYGLEQIPSAMVERIEVVRGGGSALYGASAIGGTVNIITKFPNNDNYSLSFVNSLINSSAAESNINAGISFSSDSRREGATFFAARRTREAYDHNGDGLSEMPELENNSFGANLYYRPEFSHLLEFNISSVFEYRRGGDRISEPAHLADQSEERSHNIFFGSLDYTFYYDDFRSSAKAYAGFQNTSRKHYTGIIPDVVNGDSSKYVNHFLDPPYGTTINTSFQGGILINHFIESDFGNMTASVGAEFILDDLKDKIPSYEYNLEQKTENIGAYLQIDWQILPEISLLAGLRADKHNFIENIVLNPRIAVLFDFMEDAQFRLSYATGFRAPQAFDTDIHIAFAGGGIQRIELAQGLKKEDSRSISSSVNIDFPEEDYIYGFTAEGFFTVLDNVFVLEKIGLESNGNSILSKKNGGTAEVYGITIEGRLNYDRIFQLEAGITLQKSVYGSPVKWSETIPGEKEFLRTPGEYGYFTVSLTPDFPIKASLSGVFTGPMKVPHYGAENSFGNPQSDVLKVSPSFLEFGTKVSYTLPIDFFESGIDIFVGLQNMLNSYQDDFDKGKSRDSNYIYGPSRPRTIYIGLKAGSG